MTTLSHESLLAAGYRHFEKSSSFCNLADALYQKRIRNGRDTLYFVDIWYYFHGKYPSCKDYPHGWQPEVHFNAHANQSPTFRVTLWVQDQTAIEDIEAFFARMYKAMGCEPYEKEEDA